MSRVIRRMGACATACVATTLSLWGHAEVTVIHEPPRGGDGPKAKAASSIAESTTSDEGSIETQSESGEEGASSVSEPDEPENENAGDSSPTGDTVLRTVKPRHRVSTAELDEQIAQLREERSQYGIGFPITMLAVGGATFVVGTALYAVSQTECEAPCEFGDGDEFLWMGFLGSGAALWGGVTLGSRLGPRRELGRQIKALEAEKREIQGDVSIVPFVGPTTTGLQLNVTF